MRLDEPAVASRSRGMQVQRVIAGRHAAVAHPDIDLVLVTERAILAARQAESG